MIANFKKVLRKLVGETILGMLDYYRFATWRKTGAAFNGQSVRQQLFMEILNCCHPRAIVETGTFRGTTTEFMAAAAIIPLFSVENKRRNYSFAKMRLRRYAHVVVHCGDSRDYIRQMIQLRHLPSSRVFFYLDAHWDDDLPLAEEIDVIFNFWTDAIIMIDDFQVPWDQGYGFDNYGMGKALTPEYIAPLAVKYRFSQFYPSAPSAKETGSKRGCVVLAKDMEVIERLKKIPHLRHIPLVND